MVVGCPLSVVCASATGATRSAGVPPAEQAASRAAARVGGSAPVATGRRRGTPAGQPPRRRRSAYAVQNAPCSGPAWNHRREIVIASPEMVERSRKRRDCISGDGRTTPERRDCISGDRCTVRKDRDCTSGGRSTTSNGSFHYEKRSNHRLKQMQSPRKKVQSLPKRDAITTKKDAIGIEKTCNRHLARSLQYERASLRER